MCSARLRSAQALRAAKRRGDRFEQTVVASSVMSFLKLCVLMLQDVGVSPEADAGLSWPRRRAPRWAEGMGFRVSFLGSQPCAHA